MPPNMSKARQARLAVLFNGLRTNWRSIHKRHMTLASNDIGGHPKHRIVQGMKKLSWGWLGAHRIADPFSVLSQPQQRDIQKSRFQSIRNYIIIIKILKHTVLFLCTPASFFRILISPAMASVAFNTRDPTPAPREADSNPTMPEPAKRSSTREVSLSNLGGDRKGTLHRFFPDKT